MKVTEMKQAKIPTYELGRQLEEEFWAIAPAYNPCRIGFFKNALTSSTPLVRGRNC